MIEKQITALHASNSELKQLYEKLRSFWDAMPQAEEA